METSSLDTGKIKEWRSIVTLIVFVLTNIIVLWPLHIPFWVPRQLCDGFWDTLSWLRITAPRQESSRSVDGQNGKLKPFVKLYFPLTFVTAPLIADLFLLAILAIGRQEVHDGTVGADGIAPLDIMAFFITLAYIAISIDASGLIRYFAFKVLQKAGKVGHRLFFYLYAFFFVIGSFIGNDPIILSGTAFLAYMTRVSSNIVHPRAWIFTQFAIANIASAILVSSNPTNLVLAGAFGVKFIHYTANMIVPVVVTAIVLFPFLLYIVFADESLIPMSIKMHELSEEAKAKKPVNPNIPHARGRAEEEENENINDDETKLLSLEEIMNPFLDKGGAAFGAVIMSATLVTIVALNAASQSSGEHPVFWVTCPAAFVMFCWDVGFGWYNRKHTREIARKGRREIEEARALRQEDARRATEEGQYADATTGHDSAHVQTPEARSQELNRDEAVATVDTLDEKSQATDARLVLSSPGESGTVSGEEHDEDKRVFAQQQSELHQKPQQAKTLVSVCAEAYVWCQETFPTVTAVVTHLPFALVPFALAMFVLVQALVTKGWVPVFAYGWNHWVNKTGTVGAIGGMGFLGCILCNFAGTNIGTTILLSRVIQAWQQIHKVNGLPISDRTFWGTVYGMALGVNYGAFSTAFSGALAGLLWRDILARKHIHVRALDFARVNLPIIAISMAVGCAVLVGQTYIVRGDQPYD